MPKKAQFFPIFFKKSQKNPKKKGIFPNFSQFFLIFLKKV